LKKNTKLVLSRIKTNNRQINQCNPIFNVPRGRTIADSYMRTARRVELARLLTHVFLLFNVSIEKQMARSHGI